MDSSRLATSLFPKAHECEEWWSLRALDRRLIALSDSGAPTRMCASQGPELDLIAVGAHPDDVEIACGGTLARLARKGYAIGIIDLTDGEPTPHSPGPEVRLAEAERAAEILGVDRRINLNMP